MDATGLRVGPATCSRVCIYGLLLHYEYYNAAVGTLVDYLLPTTALAASLSVIYGIVAICTLTKHRGGFEGKRTLKSFKLFSLATSAWILVLSILIVATGYDHAFNCPWDNDSQSQDSLFHCAVHVCTSGNLGP
ncbi:hypothetical protein LTR36_006355 [Oleoguttula mirabilis]|uniref:Uncharacterized protein n=1 Tax=Oleoguttula mirabilis TaxID=1507867 RepID=A0AAV9JXI9_9PEZI|nr:hypothetical protein LTR36_006355 [Oleoguttula mirabilis]